MSFALIDFIRMGSYRNVQAIINMGFSVDKPVHGSTYTPLMLAMLYTASEGGMWHSVRAVRGVEALLNGGAMVDQGVDDLWWFAYGKAKNKNTCLVIRTMLARHPLRPSYL